jgi:hypothetical protein
VSAAEKSSSKLKINSFYHSISSLIKQSQSGLIDRIVEFKLIEL